MIPGGINSMMFKAAGGAVAYTTYDSVKKGSLITLSNSDLTFSGTGTGVAIAVRGFASGDKKHWENVPDALTLRLGMAKATVNLEDSLGVSADDIGYVSASGAVRCNGGIIVTIASYTVSDRITFEFDADATVANRTLAIKKNGTLLTTITETQMVARTSSFAGTWYAAGGSFSNPSGATSNFGATTFTDTPTTGFTGITA